MEAAKVQNLLAQALREHQAGRVDQAVSLYQAILAVDPANAPALYLMGVIALARGQASMAVELTARAIAIESGQAGYHFQLGAALQTQGDLVGALASYRSALALQPDNADTYTNMGNTLAAQGKLDEALDCLLRALVLQPKNAVSHCSLGILQWRMGRREEAEASFRQAIAFQPHYVAAVINLGNIHRDKGALGKRKSAIGGPWGLPRKAQQRMAALAISCGIWHAAKKQWLVIGRPWSLTQTMSNRWEIWAWHDGTSGLWKMQRPFSPGRWRFAPTIQTCSTILLICS